jgi:tetratricopeptide (TPR) repeat protein
MTSKTPTVRQIAWISLIPQLAIMGLLITFYYLIDGDDPILYGALTYLVLSFVLRSAIPKDHKKGMALVKEGAFEEAIPFFQESYSYFTRHEWIDKYRFLTLLSSSRISYREMALNNIAFCYSQSGDGEMAEKMYLKTLEEFPGSGMAQAALRMIRSSKRIKENDN